MSINDLRKIIAAHGAGPQLEALPSVESLTWTPHPGGNPAFALVIGSLDGRQILAYLTRYGEKPREVRYCTRTPPDRLGNKSSSLLGTVTQDDVMKASLLAPFKYLAENSKPMKRKFSMLIRWYFLSKGLIDGIEGDKADFCKRFSAAVKRIDDEKRDEADGTQNRTRRNHETVEESPEPEDADSTYGLRSSSRTRKVGLANGDKAEPQSPSDKSSRQLRNSKMNHDLRRLLDYLKEHEALYLLENLPEADEMQFVDQTSLPEAQPKKLFVGRDAKSGDEIYAYMVGLPRGFHEVRFYVQTAHDEEPMKTETVAKQRVLHPFSKCYPKQPSSLEQSDRARLTLMVKFYFISAGIATDCVLKETKKYPERLRVALDYVADRMGPAAAKPPTRTGVGNDDPAVPSTGPPAKQRLSSSESSFVDESDIQSTLAAEPPRASPWRQLSKPHVFARKSAYSVARIGQIPSHTSSPHPSPITATAPTPAPALDTPTMPKDALPSPSITSLPPPSLPPPSTSTLTPTSLPSRGTKRSAEDVEFEDLARIVMKEQTLTKEINALQHDLDVLEERKSIWMAKWHAEFDALQSRMDSVTEQRTHVRKQFKKQRLSSGGEE
jgi:hypothetical protein